MAGIIGSAVGEDLLIAKPHHALHGIGLATVLGAPALFLPGENLFPWRMSGTTSIKRCAAASLLVALVLAGPHVSARALSALVAALLIALALWEERVGFTSSTVAAPAVSISSDASSDR